MTSANRSGPLYTRIAADLRSRIASGELRPGDRLPSEQQLRDRYDVSRNTVRLALHTLIHDNLVSAARGSGYYVCEQPTSDRAHPDRAEDGRDIAQVLDRLGSILEEVHALRDRVEEIASNQGHVSGAGRSRKRR